MQPTKLLYLEDFNLTIAEAKVLEVTEENGKTVVLLDQTVFYPQGGGQPYDRGVIESPAGKFLVEEVRFSDGVVKHIGRFEKGAFRNGDIVRCAIDKERRALHSRLHSAGHIVDMAVTKIGLNWVPGKGYHFPEGPYVEYAGSLDGLDKEKLKNDIEALCNEFIAEARETKMLFMDKERMKEVCRHVPDNIPEGKPARVVMYGDFGVPCGGTHVGNLKEIGMITIRKIKSEGANVRVAYDITR
jgi:Ser-tRNA(Ala) deacylase AlaX